jgi:WD40 repeat protein
VRCLRPRNSKGFECGCSVIPNRTSSRQFDLHLLQQIHHLNRIYSVDFSDDGEAIAIAYERAVRIYSIHTGDVLATLVLETESEFWDENYSADRDPDIVTCICLSTDNKLLVAGAGNGRIWICDLHGYVRQRVDQRDPLSALHLSANGRYLATSSVRTVRVWDMDQGSQYSKIRAPVGFIPMSFALSPNGRMIALCMTDMSSPIHVYDTKTTNCIRRFDCPMNENELLGRFQSYGGYISFLEGQLICASPDGRCVKWEFNVLCNEDDLTIIPLDSSEMFIDSPLDECLFYGWSPDGELLMLSNWTAHIQLWDIKGAEPCFMLCDPDITWAFWRSIP